MFPPSKRNFTHLRIYKRNCVLTSDPELSDMAGGGGLCEGGARRWIYPDISSFKPCRDESQTGLPTKDETREPILSVTLFL